MCILSLLQGHSASCECDKCYLHEPVSLGDIVEEVQHQQSDVSDILNTVETTMKLFQEISEDLMDLKMHAKTSLSLEPSTPQYQNVSVDSIICALYGEHAQFRYSLHPVVQVQGSVWKSSRFGMQFIVMDQEGVPLSQQLVFQVAAYRSTAPPGRIMSGVRSKVFLKGQCLQSAVVGTVTFEKLSFAEVSSNFPNKTVLLVVTCRSEDSVRPYVSSPVRVISRY